MFEVTENTTSGKYVLVNCYHDNGTMHVTLKKVHIFIVMKDVDMSSLLRLTYAS